MSESIEDIKLLIASNAKAIEALANTTSSALDRTSRDVEALVGITSNTSRNVKAVVESTNNFITQMREDRWRES